MRTKSITIILLLLFFIHQGYSSNFGKNFGKEIAPQFDGGFVKMRQQLIKDILLSDTIYTGLTKFRLVIDRDGTVTHVKSSNVIGTFFECNIIRNLQFVPGTVNGVPRTWFCFLDVDNDAIFRKDLYLFNCDSCSSSNVQIDDSILTVEFNKIIFAGFHKVFANMDQWPIDIDSRLYHFMLDNSQRAVPLYFIFAHLQTVPLWMRVLFSSYFSVEIQKEIIALIERDTSQASKIELDYYIHEKELLSILNQNLQSH